MSDKSDAQKIADVLEPYTGHKSSCTFTDSMVRSPGDDFCTCGLSDAVERVNEILEGED